VLDEPYLSLYRRFRPGRFEELRGQPHVVQGLRSAVRDGRVAHAYLFSGPRGTGKTSAARILARALNCASPQEGEPCGVCQSCVDIAHGVSLDVHELDAASNNGVDAMRELIAHAALATPGRWKVYIVDEVHMLSNAASNALLKTLEEPPAHVVFVLATTDPQKALPTLRSRTQHYEFRLLPAQTLLELLQSVSAQASLDLSDETLSLAVRRGRGSARDALSALDQLVASGAIEDARPELGTLIDALGHNDVEGVLVAAAKLHSSGWGPQQLASEVIDDLRQSFLLALAPQLAEVSGDERDRLTAQAGMLGLARLVRVMEVLGQAQVEMRDAPDPRVVLEVALVRLCRNELDTSPAALAERLSRVEQALTAGMAQRAPSGPKSAGSSSPHPRRTAAIPASSPDAALEPDQPAPTTVASGETSAPDPSVRGHGDPLARPTLGALRRNRLGQQAQEPQTIRTGARPGPSSSMEPMAESPKDASEEMAVLDPAGQSSGDRDDSDGQGAPASALGCPDRDSLVQAWGDHVLRTLPARAKALFSAGRFVGVEDAHALFALPTPRHRERCIDLQSQVEAALSEHFGTAVRLKLVVDDFSERAGPAPSGRRRPADRGSARGGPGLGAGSRADPSISPPLDDDDDFDPRDPGEPFELDAYVQTRLLQAFPGAEEVPG